MENPIPSSVSPIPPVPPKRNGLTTKIVIIVAAVILAGAGVVFGYHYRQQQDRNISVDSHANQPSDAGGDSFVPPSGIQYDQSTSTPDSSYGGYDPYISQKCSDRLGILPSKSGEVQWQQPERLDNLHFTQNSSSNYDVNYRVGKFVSGKYQGGDLIISIISPDGLGLTEYDHLASLNGKYYYLTKYSGGTFDKDGKLNYWDPIIKISADSDFILSDLDFPQSIVDERNGAKLVQAPASGFFRNSNEFFCADHLVKVFTDPVAGDIYTESAAAGGNPSYGFYIKSPDGMKITYQLNIDFIGPDKVPLVNWNDGTKNKDEYSYQAIGGCGQSNFRDVADVSLGELKQIGATFSGEPVYGYKDGNAQELVDLYESYYIPQGQVKPSYQDFVASRPVFFWKDPFGMFVRFKNTKYAPMAECAKPVIYLYPEKQQEVRVQLDPAGGFTYTEPEYSKGWNVLADPDGQLINLADGRTYPYLFWEGRGGMYESPSKGFVVAQADVHQFLADKLRQLGLNGKETADFLDYWEPKMQGSPYYFVSFYTNSAVDRLAPLNISPKPDTVIRILMDYKPLQQPIQVQGYQIHTPQRKGFTVVEWGGVLK